MIIYTNFDIIVKMNVLKKTLVHLFNNNNYTSIILITKNYSVYYNYYCSEII